MKISNEVKGGIKLLKWRQRRHMILNEGKEGMIVSYEGKEGMIIS